MPSSLPHINPSYIPGILHERFPASERLAGSAQLSARPLNPLALVVQDGMKKGRHGRDKNGKSHVRHVRTSGRNFLTGENSVAAISVGPGVFPSEKSMRAPLAFLISAVAFVRSSHLLSGSPSSLIPLRQGLSDRSNLVSMKFASIASAIVQMAF